MDEEELVAANALDPVCRPDSEPAHATLDEAVDETLVYTPAHPVAGGEQATFALEPRAMSDGHVAVIAFSSVAALVAQLGRFQPWLALSPENLRRLAQAHDIERVYLDPKVYPFELRWAPTHLEQLWSA